MLYEDNLRHHHALTPRDNLVDHWDEAVGEVGLPTAKVWGLYMAGSRRLSFGPWHSRPSAGR